MSQLSVRVGQTVQYVGYADDLYVAHIIRVNQSTVDLAVIVDVPGQDLQLVRQAGVFPYLDTFEGRKHDQPGTYKHIPR